MTCLSSWDDVLYLSRPISDYDLDKYVDRVCHVIRQEFEDQDVIAIKDPRICLLFPLFERALKKLGFDLKIIIPTRHPTEIASSLKARDGFSYEHSIALWGIHFLNAEKYSRNYPRVFLKYETLLKEPAITIQSVESKLDVKLPSKLCRGSCGPGRFPNAFSPPP